MKGKHFYNFFIDTMKKNNVDYKVSQIPYMHYKDSTITIETFKCLNYSIVVSSVVSARKNFPQFFNIDYYIGKREIYLDFGILFGERKIKSLLKKIRQNSK